MSVSKKTITLISNDLGLGGAYSCVMIAEALKNDFDIQLIGTVFGGSEWTGLQNREFGYLAFPGAPFPRFFETARQIRQAIVGDITIAHQYRFPSFGIGLMHRRATGTPCAVYIDDDDIALTMPGRSRNLRQRLRAPLGDIPTRVMSRLRKLADATFCGSSLYAGMYDGICVPLGRNPLEYSRDRFTDAEARLKYGFADDDVVIGFVGNPREHVGFEDLVVALEIVANPKCLLLVVPPGKISDFGKALLDKSPIRRKILEDQESHRVPEFLAASDLVVVPQRDNPVARGQISARLVDAMAMQKPIICTRISDNTTLLKDAALFVNERDPEDLADKIKQVIREPNASQEMARKARRTFLQKLSLDAMREKLLPEIERLIDSGNRL